MLKVCSNCNIEFQADRNIRKFCSQSCAATFNNKKYPKRKNTHFCYCGKRIQPKSTMCRDCFHNLQLDRYESLTLGEARREKWGKAYQYNDIRVKAKEKMIRMGVPKKCNRCGWEHHVHVSHTKPINAFTDDTKIKEINSKDNLEYLCPNCHWLFEYGSIAQRKSTTLSR